MNKLETQHSGNEQFGSCVLAIEFATTVSIIARHLKTLGDSMLSSRVDTYLYFLANGPMFEVTSVTSCSKKTCAQNMWIRFIL